MKNQGEGNIKMIWFLVAAGVCGGDLWIKKWIRDHKDLNSRQAVAGGHIVITKYFNDGAMLGALRHHARLLAGITVFLLGLVCGLLAAAAGRDGSRMLKLGLALILGGAASNAAERLTCGRVTDYFRISIGCRRLERIIFNIGDFCIFAGAALAVLAGLSEKK